MDTTVDMDQLFSDLTSTGDANLSDFFQSVRTHYERLEVRLQELDAEQTYIDSQLPLQREMLNETATLFTEAHRDLKQACDRVSDNAAALLPESNVEGSDFLRKVQDYQTCTREIAYLKSIKLLVAMHNNLTDLSKDISYGKFTAAMIKLAELKLDIHSSKCTRLVRFAAEIYSVWQSYADQVFTAAFKQALVQIGWPLLESGALPTKINPAKIREVQEIVKCWLLVFPLKSRESEIPFLRLLVAPLEIRFSFHFLSDRPTNEIEKPEWCFTQVLKWLRAHLQVITDVFEPILDQIDDPNLRVRSIRKEFAVCLSSLAANKLQISLDTLLTSPSDEEVESPIDSVLVAHWLDEALEFCEELDSMGLDSASARSLRVLEQPDILDYWLKLEQSVNMRRAEQLLAMEGSESWEPRCFDKAADDDLKVPHFCEAFMNLLMELGRRFKILQSEKAKLAVLALQKTLLDDFRVCLLQVTRGLPSVWDNRFMQALNAVSYTMMVLRYHLDHWNRYSKPDGAFDEICRLMKHMQDELIQVLVIDSMLASEVRPLLNSYYKSEKWQSYKGIGNPNWNHDHKKATGSPHFELSVGLCPLLHFLRSRLDMLKEQLSVHLFDKVLRLISAELSNVVSDEMLTLYFNENGAKQMCSDVEYGMGPLLASYGAGGETMPSIRSLVALLKLLSTGLGNALLIKDSLTTSSLAECKLILKELNLVHVEPKRALSYLQRRIDVTVPS